MQMTARFFSSTALALLALSPGLAAEKPRLDPSIVKVADAYLKAVMTRDLAALSATFREDAVEMPPNRPPRLGRAAIEQYYRELFEGPVKITEFTFSHLEAVATGDIGHSAGAYEQTLSIPSGESINDQGKFVAILKRSNGAWKTAYVIYNSDRPSAGPCAVGVAPGSLYFAPVMNYYSDLASEWLFRSVLLSLAFVCIWGIVRLLRKVLRRNVVGRPIRQAV